MATRRGQRIGIWIIAVAMIVGTVASFFALILTSENDTNTQRILAEYQSDYAAYQTKVDAQTKQLSDQYYADFSQYASRPAAFDAASVTTLSSEDVKVGDGQELAKDANFTAYYIGWNPTGKVFDQSIDTESKSLKTPLDSRRGLIEGFKEGVVGMKVGGVRVLTIPAAKAYGEAGSGADIPANTPLKFLVMIIPQPEEIKEPEVTQELIDAYSKQQQ